MAYNEVAYLEKINRLDSDDIDESLTHMTTFDDEESGSMINRILRSTSQIIDKKWMNSDESGHEVTLAIAASKRKLERELDWTFCSFDEGVFSALTHSKENLLPICNMITPSIVENGYNPDSAFIVGDLFAKLKHNLNGREWKNSQHLSFLFKDYNENMLLDINTKMVPDANDLSKVISIISEMDANGKTAKEMARSLKVSERMSQYYLDAAVMLGLCYQDHKLFYISEFGEKLNRYSADDRKSIIEKSLLQLPIIRAFLLHLNSLDKNRFQTRDIAKFLHESTELSLNTSMRRASTLASWLSSVGLVKRFDKTMILKHDDGQMKLGGFL